MQTAQLFTDLVVAAGAGAVLGAEREFGGRHNAGFRTHLLVSLGACLFTLLGAYGFASTGSVVAADPTRVAAQVASGIGFIGAGAILRDGVSVRGLTTAATLWVAAAAGAAAGAGLYGAIAITVALAVTALLVLRGVRAWHTNHLSRRPLRIVVEYTPGSGTLGPLARGLQECGAAVRSLQVDDYDGDDTVVEVGSIRRVEMRVRPARRTSLSTVLDAIRERPEVRAAYADDH